MISYEEAIELITLARRAYCEEHGEFPSRVSMNKSMRDLLVEAHKSMKVVHYKDDEFEQVCGMAVELSDLPDGRFIVSGGVPLR